MKKYPRRLLAAVCTLGLLMSAASALTVEEAVELLEEYYVNDLPASAYEAGTLDELFQAVGDPYTYYMDAETYQKFNNSVEGESKVGIGVAISYEQTGIVINSVIPGGTAEEAGLKAGDTIIAIDGGTCVPGQESDVTRITGVEGTEVTLDVLRADGTQVRFTLKRRGFTVPTTTVSLLENGSGYLDCASFAGNTGTAFAEGMERYNDQTALWLVDLQDNTGGRVDGARGAAAVFTGPGFIAWMRDAGGNFFYYFNTDPKLTDAPAVVLTNGNSASASEIFSSTIKDYGVGIVVGGRTYGKGVAQIVLNEDTNPELFQGDAIKITAYRYYSANLNTMDCIGTLPTLLIPNGRANDVALLLRAQEPEDPAGWLRLTLDGWDFYVNAAQEDEADRAALAALFSALPPDVPAAVSEDGVWTERTVPQAAAALGIAYTSRWLKDVADSPYAAELNTLATYKLLRGVGGGSYQPERSMTRAELCAMVCRALNRTSSAPAPFDDVPGGAWYAPYVSEMAEMGLVNGKGNGCFDPGGTVSQQELVTVLGRLAGFLNANCGELLRSVEEEQLSGDALAAYAGWARPYAWLLGSGYRDNVDESVSALFFRSPEEIDPHAPATRAEAGAALYRLLTGLDILVY